jgi:hypothetical protein
MDNKKLIFKIAKDGQLTVEGSGFKGASCLEKSQQYLRGLGTISKQDKKPEFYERDIIQITNFS